MKQRLFNCILVILLLILLVSCASIKTTATLRHENQLYKDYVTATEAFLDQLDDDYDWIDAYDPYDYYEAVENLVANGLMTER